MNMGSFSSDDHLPPALLANFDIDLQRFYLEALNKELDIQKKQNAQNIKKALKEVVEAYKKRTGDGPDFDKSIRFDTSEKRCAYVLKHSPCFTSAVARHVLGLVGECPRAFRDVILRGEASICCLGGGPASDAVGVCKVLSDLCRQSAGKRLKLKVTVVDVNEDWAVTAGNVLETLKDMPELLGVEGVELSFDFFSADLTRPIDDAVRKVVESADIVTMVYFLSAVNRGRDTIESFRMVKEIMKCMRNGGILFFLDSAMDVHYKQMSSAAESLGNMLQIYGPRVEEFHTLSLDSVRSFFDLYKRDFGKFLCLTNCFVSSSAWHKTIPLPLECNCKSCTATVDREMLNNTEEYDTKSHSLQMDKLRLEKLPTLSMNNVKMDKSPTLLMRNLQDKSSEMDKAVRVLPDKTDKSMCLSMRNLQDKSSEMDSNMLPDKTDKTMCLSLRNLKDNCAEMDKAVRTLPDKTDKSLLDMTKMDNSELVGKLLMNSCSRLMQEEDLMWRKSHRQAVSQLTARMVKFRAQIGRLLAAEFEHVDVEIIEVFDEIDPPPDDVFDSLLTEYFHSVPEYFFQTKSKKKRIFTGLPVSI